MFDSGVRDATDAVIALTLGATAVGIGRPYAYALSYGGSESLTDYLKSLLAEFDLTLAICGFKDIATLTGRLRTGAYLRPVIAAQQAPQCGPNRALVSLTNRADSPGATYGRMAKNWIDRRRVACLSFAVGSLPNKAPAFDGSGAARTV
jgi:hypothetical protein